VVQHRKQQNTKLLVAAVAVAGFSPHCCVASAKDAFPAFPAAAADAGTINSALNTKRKPQSGQQQHNPELAPNVKSEVHVQKRRT